VIASLRGTVLSVEADRATVETGGVGFAVQAPATLLAKLSRDVGAEVFVHTYLHVRDDALQLFGFASSREREFFLTLIGVSGVGPKVGLAILSAYPVDQLETAVMRDDTRKFEAIPGIGKKLAQRLMIELKDKVGPDLSESGVSAGGLAAGEAVGTFILARQALEGLGLTLREAEEALKGAPEEALLEELVRYALKRKAAAPPGAQDSPERSDG
jgi:Holliday junction DNA helicase RuvA